MSSGKELFYGKQEKAIKLTLGNWFYNKYRYFTCVCDICLIIDKTHSSGFSFDGQVKVEHLFYRVSLLDKVFKSLLFK